MSKQATTKGAALAVVVTGFIIAAAGFTFWYVHGAAPSGSVVRLALTATVLPTATPTLTPTPSPLPTPSPRPTATPAPTATPVPTVMSAPHMILSSYFINETDCGGTFSPVSAITVTNDGGGTLIWQATSATVYLTRQDGPLAAGQSWQITMYWDSWGPGQMPPIGGNTITFTSNGGNASVYVGCSGASAPVGTYTPPAG